MVKAEKAFKWGIAIVVIFGIINAFYFLNIIIALKIALPIICVFMIGSILLQSGKGGGLAAIGGLGDQSAFGTRTSTFLSKVTYLIGAAFIVTTIFLFKLTVDTRTIHTIATEEAPAAQHTHEHLLHEEGHTHGDVPVAEEAAGKTSLPGMQKVDEEQSNKSGQESFHQQAVTKDKGQSAGMGPVEDEKQTSGVTEKPVNEKQEEAGDNSNK